MPDSFDRHEIEAILREVDATVTELQRVRVAIPTDTKARPANPPEPTGIDPIWEIIKRTL